MDRQKVIKTLNFWFFNYFK